MRIFSFLIVLVLLWLPGPISAEYYKYRDQNGVLRYTDNLADIPEDQRPKMETRDQAEDFLSPQERAAKARKEADERRKALTASEIQEKPSETLTSSSGGGSAEQMRSTRDALEAEYAEMMKAKQALEAKRNTLVTAVQVKAYQKEVTQLNAKVAAFEKRREAFKQEVDAFNKQLGQ